MYDIKELTKDLHQIAEQQSFIKTLMSTSTKPGASTNISSKLYAIYLYNQLLCYAEVEKYGLENSLFRTTTGLPRAEHIHYDFKALWTGDSNPTTLPSTVNYIKHIQTIKEEPEKLYAHIYVRHLRDMTEGQLMMKNTPGPNRYCKFRHGEIKEYKRIVTETINSYINVYQINVLNEARIAYETITLLYQEMDIITGHKDLKWIR